MFVMVFNLGLQELIILAVLGLLMAGMVAAAVILIVVLSNRAKGRDDSADE